MKIISQYESDCSLNPQSYAHLFRRKPQWIHWDFMLHRLVRHVLFFTKTNLASSLLLSHTRESDNPTSVNHKYYLQSVFTQLWGWRRYSGHYYCICIIPLAEWGHEPRLPIPSPPLQPLQHCWLSEMCFSGLFRNLFFKWSSPLLYSFKKWALSHFLVF